jgi:hypothetical protein
MKRLGLRKSLFSNVRSVMNGMKNRIGYLVSLMLLKALKTLFII